MSSVAEETAVTGDWTALDGSQQRVAVEVLRHGPLPRAELARSLGLSPGSLTRLTRPLVDSGLLVESSSDVHARTGRPSLPLDVQPSSRRFAGVKITGDALFAVVTDLRAAVLAEHDAPLAGRGPEAVVDAVADVVARLREEHGEVAGLGIGIGGRVAARRDVTRAHFLGWQETVPLAQRLQAATGLPTVVENDVRALTVAEHWFGAGPRAAVAGRGDDRRRRGVRDRRPRPAGRGCPRREAGRSGTGRCRAGRSAPRGTAAVPRAC